MSPSISVIMAIYNSESFLEEAVSSVRSQTVQDWELIAVDDGSADGSVRCLERLATVGPVPPPETEPFGFWQKASLKEKSACVLRAGALPMYKNYVQPVMPEPGDVR